MCDGGDLLDAGSFFANAPAFVASKLVGLPTPADVVKTLFNKPGTPKVPALPPQPGMTPIDPSDAIIQRAMAAERKRAAATGPGSSYLNGARGLQTPAPIRTPTAGGY